MALFSLSALSAPALVEIYNTLADKPVNRFASAEVGRRRVSALLASAGKIVVEGDNGGWSIAEATPTTPSSIAISRPASRPEPYGRIRPRNIPRRQAQTLRRLQGRRL